MWESLPEFGTGVLCATLVAAAYTMAVGIAAGRGRPRLLQAARLGAYGTVSLVGLAVLVLAYAFVSHDFRISYVAHYSDRTMSTPYLVAALWGGQDGSLLWWLFLSAFFAGVCLIWLGQRYRELQPYVIATLMGNLLFFTTLMLFGDTNPFSTSAGGAPMDGNGLNYQLRNFYMIIHPPSLYTGFTSATVPFAFAVSALVTGRLDNEWIVATRKWMLFSWLFLSIGNTLGMLWAYEELGWGGPWAWDPVENAAFLPWVSATAYVHSTMIQERRGMLKVWNVSLIALTFFLTIFGTWLTRSGLIASVHSFAQSGIGIYFVWYMVVLLAVSIALIVYRLPRLRSEGSIDSALSREATFLFNNWGLLSVAIFVAVATVWPRISEWLLNQKSTLGPTFYNAFVPLLALPVFLAMGLAPLLGWRKTSSALLRRSFVFPLTFTALVSVFHFAFGRKLGFAPIVHVDPIYDGSFGRGLAAIASTYPAIIVLLAAFNVAVVSQEFFRGIAARQKAHTESLPLSLARLVAKSRRRYGGYIVHVGVAIMMLGFAGRAWSVDKDTSLKPGEQLELEGYTLSYVGPRMEVDAEKRMIFADLDVTQKGRPLGRLSPARFIYKSSPGAPSTEVARHISLRDDLYVVIGMVNPQNKIAAIHVHVNTLISWIWFGAGVLLLGTMISLWPDVQFERVSSFAYVRVAASSMSGVLFAFLIASGASLTFFGPTAPFPDPVSLGPVSPGSAAP